MPDYPLSLTASEIDAALQKASNPDTEPQQNDNLITSGGVKTYVDGAVGDFAGKTVTTEATGIGNTDNDTSIPTSAAVKDYVNAYVDASSTSGFLPSSYTGQESVTLPNGLIMKFGTSSVGSNATKNITFGTAFTSAINAQLTVLNTSSTYDYFALKVGSLSSSGLSVINTNAQFGGTSFYWMVIGR
jgi:hypothetical protein